MLNCYNYNCTTTNAVDYFGLSLHHFKQKSGAHHIQADILIEAPLRQIMSDPATWFRTFQPWSGSGSHPRV